MQNSPFNELRNTKLICMTLAPLFTVKMMNELTNISSQLSTVYLVKCSYQVYSIDSYLVKSGILTIKQN